MKDTMDKPHAKLSYYEQLLPQSVRVEVHQEEDGSFWAKILDFTGCYTQGKSFTDLLEMISDAVYIVNDVPEELRVFMPRYIPRKIKEELERPELQNQFDKFIASQIHENRELEFAR